MGNFEFLKPEYINEDSGNISKNIKNAKVDLQKDYGLPEYVIKIKDGDKWYNIGSLGNFSCLTGRAKARKSFARFFFEAAAISGRLLYDKFFVRLPAGKEKIIYIDTEQSKGNVSFAAKRIMKMANINHVDNYEVFCLRENTYTERCEMVEQIIKENKNLGILFLDGIADLASENNNEVEGNRVSQLLMTWTAKYNIHIMTVIHQPRSHEGATGHLGASVEKKAEAVIATKKEGGYSVISSALLRLSADFAPFPFEINNEYIPVLVGTNEIEHNISGIYEKEEEDDDDEIPF